MSTGSRAEPSASRLSESLFQCPCRFRAFLVTLTYLDVFDERPSVPGAAGLARGDGLHWRGHRGQPEDPRVLPRALAEPAAAPGRGGGRGGRQRLGRGQQEYMPYSGRVLALANDLAAIVDALRNCSHGIRIINGTKDAFVI